jgi:vanillate O-demethylase monooxygenase subunit
MLDIASYPLVERGPLLWIWMGDPARADVAAIPDHSWLQDPRHSHVLGYFHVKSNYVPLHENVLDLTHLHYLHGSDVGALSFVETPPKTTVTNGVVRVLREDRDTLPPPHYARMAGIAGHRADRVSEAECPSPALSWARATIIDREAAPGARNEFHFWVMHGLTPAHQHETHYFWANVRDCSVGDADIDAWLLPRSTKVLSEDVEALQWCQDIWRQTAPESYSEMSVAADTPGMHVRRMIAQLAAQEQKQTARRAG